MKYFQQDALVRLCGITAIILAMAGCATSQAPTGGKQPTPLSASENAVYQEALSNMKAGDMDKASAGFKKVTQSHPDFIAAWINLASSYYTSKKIAEANSALTQAKNINPNLAEVQNLTGLLNVEKGEYQAAEKNYLAALALNKDYANAHYNLALVYDIFYQDINKAIPHYERYLALSGNSDKSTLSWVTELKAKLKRKGG